MIAGEERLSYRIYENDAGSESRHFSREHRVVIKLHGYRGAHENPTHNHYCETDSKPFVGVLNNHF